MNTCTSPIIMIHKEIYRDYCNTESSTWLCSAKQLALKVLVTTIDALGHF